MPAINIELTPDELVRVRARAAADGRSMRSYAHDTLIRCTDRTSRDAVVSESAARIIRISGDLLRRLASQ
jgi:hypothetical protein